METTLVAKTWAIDSDHSKIQFKVKHLVISTVTGSFDEFEGQMKTKGELFENAQITFLAKTKSINTHSKDRDNHLRSDDFFNAAKYPEIKFSSTSFREIKTDEYELIGKLTIRDKTKEIKLRAQYSGEVIDPYGQIKVAFEIEGQISRKDFDLKWGAVTETGSVVVGDEVKLILEVTVILK